MNYYKEYEKNIREDCSSAQFAVVIRTHNDGWLLNVERIGDVGEGRRKKAENDVVMCILSTTR